MSAGRQYSTAAQKQKAYRERKIKAFETDLAQWIANRDAEQQRHMQDFNFQSIRIIKAYEKLAQHNPAYQESLEKSLPAIRTHYVTLRMLEYTEANPRPQRPRF
jgi:site-specific recombinase XerD